MDFLDPKKKRAHRIRLMIGYVLMTIVVGIGTVILVYEAYGFGYNREAGQVVQNGLVFIDSAPKSAEIYVNGEKQGSGTDARLVLPAGQYRFELKRGGYHNWQRSLFLEAGSLERLVYPILIPTAFSPKTIETLNSTSGLATQSPDRRWILQQVANPDPQIISFFEYDTNVKPSPQKRQLNLPSGLLKNGVGTLKESEWSTDNRHLLVESTTATGKEFIIIDRDDTAKSFNVNTLFSVTPLKVSLRDKKADQLYVLTANENSLSVANIAQKTIGQPILKRVLEYKPYGSDILVYITDNTAEAGTVRSVIWERGQNYNLQVLPAGDKYVADSAKYDGHYYVTVGSNKLDRVLVYKDPVENIKSSSKRTATPLLALNVAGVQQAGFSATARFIAVQSGQNFGIYDFEAKDTFKYTLDSPLSGPMRWMDGHRLLGTTASKAIIMDFDGINRHVLVNSTLSSSAFFDRDYRQMYVTVLGESGQGIVWQRVSMYSEADTPDNLK